MNEQLNGRLAEIRDEALAQKGLTPKYASTGSIPGRECTVVDRIGGTLQVVSHGSLIASELDGLDGDSDANIEYIEVALTRPSANSRAVSLVTPEAAIVLGRQMVELGRHALLARQALAEQET